MQKSIILLSLLFSLPAFAADDVERAALIPQRVIPSAGVSSSASTLRSVSYRGGDTTSGNTSVADRRATGARNAVSRETSVARTTTAGGGSVVRQRNVDDVNNRTVAVRSGNSTVSGGANTARVGTSAAVVTASGKTGGGLVARGPSVSVSQNMRVVNAENVAAVKSNFESLSGLKDTCKASYYQCMDNFCNNLDENMGRCACSKSIKNYAKTEEALAAATQELQEVAQKIQYIGLTPTEITTLFTETEAETALGQKVDNSKIKNDLDRIKNMIVGVKSGSSSAAITENSGISLDLSNLLSFNIDSVGFDITGLFGNQTQNTQSILNQRGEALYKSAAARCKSAILNDCSTYGIDAAVIVNSYDVEIDKDCMLYERKLTDENTAMLSTIRNAKTVLQKARLMVAQQKNEYDLRGCISALDSCMQDDFVCGTDYEECLDPTGKYIVDGAVVVGSMPGVARGTWGDDGTDASASSGLYTVWNNNNKNIWAPSGDYSISEYISNTMSLKNAQENLSDNMSIWLQHRMGYHDNSSKRNYGMCVSILNKCQKYTYDKEGNYLGENTVIQSWLSSAFRKIKQGQDRVLMNYAQTCLGDVTSCLNQNNFGMYSNVSDSSGTNPSDIAIKACLSVINTCRSVTMGLSDADVSIDNLSDIYVWLDAGIGTAYQSYCESTGGTWTPKTEATYDGSCSCDGDGLAKASTTSNKYCVCTTAGYEWSATENACVDPSAPSSSSGGNGGNEQQGGDNGNTNPTNTTVMIMLDKAGGSNPAGGSVITALYVNNGKVYGNSNLNREISVDGSIGLLPTKNGYNFSGFYESANGTTQYIDNNGHLEQSGYNAAIGYTSGTTWYAKWTSN
ncbi:MAG: InlB B-repeat-containing protein [Alphaproteobacteria bacterium]|nr:InlB B-repeat-containing protein [Alphaproteobacteria bacterium]